MALNKQLVPIILKDGINQKIDEKVLPAGMMAKLENVVLRKGGRYSKRYGTVNLTKNKNNGLPLESANGLATYGNELLMFSDSRVYSYGESPNAWYDKYSVPISELSITQIIRNTQQQDLGDTTIGSGITVSAWEDTRGGVRMRAMDRGTGTILIDDLNLLSTASRPKTVSVEPFSFIFYRDGANIYVRRYDKSTATTIGSQVSLISDLNASGFYDVCVQSGNMVIVWHTLGNEIKIAYVTPTPVLGSTLVGLPNPVTHSYPVTGCLTVWNGQTTQQIYVAWFDSATGVNVMAVKPATFALSFSPTVVDSTLTPDVRNISGAQDTSTTLSYLVYERDAAQTYNTYVQSAGVRVDGTIFSSPYVVRRASGLASKLFIKGSKQFFHLSHDSVLQATYFLCDLEGLLYSRALYQTAGGQTKRDGHLPEVTFVDDVASICSVIKTKIVTENNTTYLRKGLCLLDYNLSSEISPQTVALGQNLHLFCAIPQVYDGISFVELGFNQYPENITYTTDTTGGNMSDGTYSYVFTYEWVDAKGQIHRSATSVPIEVTLSGGTSTQRVNFAIPTLRLTSRWNNRNESLIVAYRTENNGQIYYRVSSSTTSGGFNGLVLSDAAVDTRTFTDALADSSIITNEAVYTTGGILDNFPPPPSTVAVVYKNRIVTNSSDETGLTIYSKQSTAGEAVSFTQEFSIAADPEGKPTRAFGIVDDKLLIAKDDVWFATAGQGPNDAGQFNDFIVPERLAVSVGCSEPQSVVVTKEGIIFKSARGFYMIGRDLSETFIGAPVEDFNSLSIASSLQMPVDNEVRFIHRDGQALVYNIFFQQWSTFTNYAAQDAVLWRSIFTMVDGEGQVRQETENQYSDNGAYYSMLIELGWVSLGQVQGFQRIYRLLILGTYQMTLHKLRIKVAKDFEPTWRETIIYNPQDALNTTTYGTGTYGSQTPYGGELDSVYQARIHLATQKCQSIKFQISDIQTTEVGEGLTLTALTLEAGVKNGAAKTSIAKGAGSLG